MLMFLEVHIILSRGVSWTRACRLLLHNMKHAVTQHCTGVQCIHQLILITYISVCIAGILGTHIKYYNGMLVIITYRLRILMMNVLLKCVC